MNLYLLCRLVIGFVIVVIVIGLGACAQRPQINAYPDHVEVDWSEHQQQLGTLKNWAIVGKLGIRTSGQTSSARFNWKQQHRHFDIQVTSPFGQGLATLSGTDDSIYLNIAGRGEYITHTPEELLLRELGWALPVAMLNYWLKGMPAPGVQMHYQLGQRGLLKTMQQAGWQLHFSRYQDSQGYRLPSKILLQQNDIKLTLLIKRWSL